MPAVASRFVKCTHHSTLNSCLMLLQKDAAAEALLSQPGVQDPKDVSSGVARAVEHAVESATCRAAGPLFEAASAARNRVAGQRVANGFAACMYCWL